MGVPPLRKFIKPPLDRTFYSAVVIRGSARQRMDVKDIKKEIKRDIRESAKQRMDVKG